MRKIYCLAALGPLLLAGCNDSVSWVEPPNQSFKCEQEEIDDFNTSEFTKSNYSIMGEKACKDAGKGEFAVKIRCKNDVLQYACSGK